MKNNESNFCLKKNILEVQERIPVPLRFKADAIKGYQINMKGMKTYEKNYFNLHNDTFWDYWRYRMDNRPRMSG